MCCRDAQQKKSQEKQNDTHCAAIQFAAGATVIENEIPSFCLNQGSSTPNNFMRRIKAVWVPSLENLNYSQT